MSKNNQFNTFFWIVPILFVIVLVTYNLYLGFTVKKIGIPCIFEIEFGSQPHEPEGHRESTGKAPTIEVHGEWSKGALVEVIWQDTWYKAEIRDIQGNLYNIHYKGFDNSWDEWIPFSRIRAVAPNEKGER